MNKVIIYCKELYRFSRVIVGLCGWTFLTVLFVASIATIWGNYKPNYNFNVESMMDIKYIWIGVYPIFIMGMLINGVALVKKYYNKWMKH